jgi:iron complex outermembrane recepter protein
MTRTFGVARCVALALAGTLLVPLGAQRSPGPGSAGVLHAQAQEFVRTAAIHGRVVDAQTLEPIGGAYVRIRELGRNEHSHRDGSFHFERLTPGTYTILAQRIGYAPAERTVVVSAGHTERLTIPLGSSAIQIPGVVVTGTGRERAADEVYRPTTVLNGAELRRRLGSSVAATLADEPGITQRYNGPAAAQPVVRGLSGDRVLVLEDGLRTGDVATTAADHAIAIEPLTAERIEVVRGPAGLLYGSNALGGVINVIRDEVPRTLPERLSGMLSLQVESVNRGGSGGGFVLLPIGHIALRGELSGRMAGETRTPLGVLPSTDMRGFNAGVGASWIGSGSFFGAAIRDYGLTYGVPGTFNGQTIPGAHPGGVSIEMRRTAARVQGGLFSRLGPLSSLEFDGNYVRFHQDEIEQGGFVGTRFGQLLGTANVIARHRHEAGNLFSEGAFGAFFLGRDFATSGSATGSHPARQFAVAGYGFEELGWHPFRLQLGARYDRTRIEPRSAELGGLDDVRSRDFGAFSGSVAGLADIARGWTVGVSLARAFRTPSIEELYSDGPHLADFSYNIGNPDLAAEFGLGLDIFVRAALPRLHGEVSVFRNQVSNFIYHAPVFDPVTGEPVLDPRFRRFPVYRAQQDNSNLLGAEGKLQWELLHRLVMDASASYVQGTRSGDSTPLPFMPPLHGSVGLRYDAPGYFVGAGWEGNRRQERLGEFETPTPGSSLWNATAGVRWSARGQLHSVTLQVRNLGDEVWWDHLSRIKQVAPQPGRNVQLLYRLNF